MRIIREKVDISINRNLSEAIWEEVSKSFRPIIYGARSDMRDYLGENTPDIWANFGGDLFINDSGQIFYYLINEERTNIEIGTVLPKNEGLQVYSGFKDILTDFLSQVTKSQVNWINIHGGNQQFESIKQISEIFKTDTKEIEAAFLLRDGNVRDILRHIYQNGEIFQEDLRKGPDDAETDEIVNSLENLGLISREFYLFCRSDGKQISKINSLQSLEDAKSHGFKCFSCGRLFSEERISPLIKCTLQGEKLSSPNYWLALLLSYSLSETGIDMSNVYYTEENNGKVFNVFVILHGRFIMFELHDEQMKLDDVFRFLSRINYYKPNRSVLITSNLVSIDARMYLRNTENKTINLVEGFDDLERVINESLKYNRDSYIQDLFRDLRRETRIDIEKVIVNKISKYYRETPGDIKTALRAESHGISPEEEEEPPFDKILDFSEVIPSFDSVDTEDYYLTDSSYTATDTTEMFPDFNTDIETQEMEPVDGVKFLDENLVPAFDEIEENEDIKEVQEESKTVEEAETGDSFGEFKLDFNESLSFDTSDNRSGDFEEISDDDMESAAKQLLLIAEGFGVSSNLERIQREMTSNFDNSLLVDDKGLILLSNFKDSADQESLGAYSVAFSEGVKRIFMDSGLEKPASIYIDGSIGMAKIFLGHGLCLVSYETKKSTFNEEESGFLPGETLLREAVIKKVIDDLIRTEGIEASILSGRDGLVIEGNISGDFDESSVSYMSSQIISEKSLYRLQIGDIKQILIKCEDIFYNLIPLRGEAVLIACLDPQVPHEVWQNKLPRAAQMISSTLV